MSTNDLALGLDIGGTNARAAVVERATGRLVVSKKQPLTAREPAAVVEAVARLIEQVEGDAPKDLGVGVGFAGMLDGGRVVNAPNFGWQNVELASLLSKRAGRSVKLINDLASAAWGEFSVGSARGATHSLTVFVGTGVGSALISNGVLQRGTSGVAGEFGHIKVVLDGGRRCGCGQTGCLEAYAGGANIEAAMREQNLEGNAGDLEKLSEQGVGAARALYDFAVDHLGLAIANYVTLTNPGVLVLGGGVLSKCPGMLERVKRIVHARTNAPAAKAVTVAMAALGDDAGLVGAALLGAAR